MKSDDRKLASVVRENTEEQKLSAVLREIDKDEILSTLPRETRNTVARNISDYAEAFTEIVAIIERARENAFRAVNRLLISMYWDVGKYISNKVNENEWGKSTVKEFAFFMQANYPEIKGFSASNVWRMRQFYEFYHENEKLAPLVREISWTNNLMIIAKAKTDEEREFYLLLCSKNNYTKRELERQINSLLFERTICGLTILNR